MAEVSIRSSRADEALRCGSENRLGGWKYEAIVPRSVGNFDVGSCGECADVSRSHQRDGNGPVRQLGAERDREGDGDGDRD